MSRPTSPACKTRNWPAHNDALKRRGSLTIWFDPAMTWEAAPTGKRGRQPDYSGEEDQETVRWTVSPTNGTPASMVARNGVFARLLEPVAQPGSRRKIHIGIDEKTLEIRAAEFTTSDVGDAPMPPELLDQIPPEQEIASVTADGAVDTRKCHDVIAARGAAAIIPPRKNARPWRPDTAGAIARNEILRTSKRFGFPWSGDDGAGITAEAAPKPRSIASSSWASASPRARSTVRSQSSTSAWPS